MDWVRGKRLGHGSFGTVNLARPRSQNSSLPPLMAVKSCDVLNSSSLVNEKLILEELKDCPEIIRCFGESFSYENGDKLYNVLLEYASGGSLADKLKKSNGQRLPESEVRQYTKALLRGLDYIHKFGYVHCDFKLQNILLCSNGCVKIADFGLAKRAGEQSAVPGCELRGTPMYMSPEMVSSGDRGAPVDIWSLGCAVSEMVSGSPPWSCSDVAALLWKIGVSDEVPKIPRILSDEGKDFLEKCFVKNPSERWTAEMLLNHPFIRDQDFRYDNVPAKQEKTASTSPRSPFEFLSSITSLPSPGYFPESGSWLYGESNLSEEPSPAERLQELLTGQLPDWSVSNDWVTIR